jgi:hypothetical protein
MFKLNLGKKKWVSVGIFLFLFLLIGVKVLTGGFFLIGVMGANVDQATGSFTIDSAPTVTNIDFVNGTDYTTVNTLYPDNTQLFGVNFTLTHNGKMADLLNVTVWIYDDSVYGATYQSASPDGLQLIRAVWLESTSAWTIAQGSFTEWSESGSIDPATSDTTNTTYDCVFSFDISRAARYDTDWNVSIGVFDDDDDYNLDSESALVTMAKNFEISFSSATFSWGSVQSNSVNNTHGALSLNVRANYDWKIAINGTDFNDTTDIEAQNIVAWDEDGSNGGISQWLRNTRADALGTWIAQSPMATETALTRNTYWFLSTGAYFTEGNAYELTIYIWILTEP